MFRASSSSFLLCGRVQRHRSCRQLGQSVSPSVDGPAQRRLLSFKALANRNNAGGSSRRNDGNDDTPRRGQQQQPQRHRRPQPSKTEGGFADVVRGNGAAPAAAAGRTSHDRRPPPSRNAPGGSAPPSSSSAAGPPPWQQRQRRDAPRPPSTFGFRDRGNTHNSRTNVRSSVNDNVVGGRQMATPGDDGDLRDISRLRDTFVRDRNRPPPRESWRAGGGDGNLASSRASFTLSNAPKRPDPTAAAAGVGTKWTPSFYKKKSPPPASIVPPLAPTGGGVGGSDAGVGVAGSLEQAMRANAIRRREDMEARYRGAGERVPHERYGNPDRGTPGRYGWRDGGRGGAAPGNRNWRGGGQGGGDNRGGHGGNRDWAQRQGRQQQHQTTRQPFWKERQRKQIRKHLPPSTPSSVRLPSTPLALVDLSLLLRVRKRTLVRTLRSLGEQVAYTDAQQDSCTIDTEMMELICIELGIEPVHEEKKESEVEEAEGRAMRRAREDLDEEAKTEEEERYAALPPRSPVVSIMGHVDHGKTTLMDALRRRAVTGEGTPKGAGKTAKGKKGKKKKGQKGGGKKSRGKGGVSVDDGNVAGTEAGGITQVITAFEVPLPLEDSGEGDAASEISTVTFLDTPGHAAFKKMRQSGSSATDVIVLVVAADDGVSPQTVEIIDMYRSIARAQPQSISLVVAVSKIDKHGVDVDEAVMRIENQLMEHEIFTENVLAGGGDEGEFGACQLFPVSGVTGEGLDDLVEGLALQSEIMDLRADPDAKGEGIVIDARMERGLGVVADCVIRWGSVSKGDFVVSGTNGGRVKFLNDVENKPLAKARPSQPARIVGFKSLPKAGDPIVCANSEEDAKELIRIRESEMINEERAEFDGSDVELQVTGTAAKQGMMMQKEQKKYGFGGEDDGEGGDGGDENKKETIYIPVVIKADSHGTLEAVRDALVSIGTESELDIVIDPVEMSTGVVTSSDVVMARESDAGIFVFGNVGVADKETKNAAAEDNVSIRSHDIIYRLLEDAKEYFGRYLPVEYADRVHGKATIQAVFDVTDAKTKKSVNIAGLRVTDGHLFKEKSDPGLGGNAGGKALPCYYRVIRGGRVITDDAEPATKRKKNAGIIASSLRRVKEDADSVRNGEECGLGLDGFHDLKEGDVVECYSVEERRAAI